MNITYLCPKCDEATRTHFTATERSITCMHCQQEILIPENAIQGEEIKHCLSCPSTDLYVRKDFPQILGVGIVAVGLIGSAIPWYYSYVVWTYVFLFGTALIDLLLYSIVPNCLMCYRCEAQYRGCEDIDQHGEFDLEVHEKYRQIAARTKAARVESVAKRAVAVNQTEASQFSDQPSDQPSGEPSGEPSGPSVTTAESLAVKEPELDTLK